MDVLWNDLIYNKPYFTYMYVREPSALRSCMSYCTITRQRQIWVGNPFMDLYNVTDSPRVELIAYFQQIF